MALVIALLIAGTLAIAAFLVWPRTPTALLQFDGEPDTPLGFGRDMSWLAVRTNDTTRLQHVLGLRAARSCNWANGIGAAYDPKFRDAFVFIAPPVDGWSFVVSRGLPHPLSSKRLADQSSRLLENLSRQFGECHYFSQFPELEMTAWMRGIDGRIVRALAADGDGPFLEIGQPTKVERHFGLGSFDLVGLAERSGDVGGKLLFKPKPEHVFEVAARWSIDPTKLGKLSRLGQSSGVIGHVPTGWRPVVQRRDEAQAA